MNFANHQILPLVSKNNSKISTPRSISKINQRSKSLIRVANGIYIGSIDQLINYKIEIEILKDSKMKNILNLTNDIVGLSPQSGVECLNCPISSKSFCSLMKSLPECIEYIDKTLLSGKDIVICCRDGFSKTFVVLCAYYILRYNKNYETIQNTLKSTIPDLPNNVGSGYEEHLKNMCKMVGIEA